MIFLVNPLYFLIKSEGIINNTKQMHSLGKAEFKILSTVSPKKTLEFSDYIKRIPPTAACGHKFTLNTLFSSLLRLHVT